MIITPMIAHSHHFLKIDFFGSPIVATVGVIVGVVVVDCSATGCTVSIGVMFDSPTINVISNKSI